MPGFPNHPAAQHVTIIVPEKIENKRAIQRTLTDLVEDLRDVENVPRDDIAKYVHDIRRVSEYVRNDATTGVSVAVTTDPKHRFNIETSHATCDDAGTVRKALGELVKGLVGENLTYEVKTEDRTDHEGRLVIRVRFELH